MDKEINYSDSVRSSINNIRTNLSQSIFDSLNNEKIVESISEQVSLRLPKVLQIGQLGIIKQKSKVSNKKHVFVLSKDYLYYASSYPLIVDRNYEFRSRARIRVSWLQTRFYTINGSHSNDDGYYIEIIKKNKSITLVCDRINEFNAWVTNLSSHSIQTNFFKKFTIDELLYKGNRSIVYKITNKHSSEKFACKKFKKSAVTEPETFNSLINEIKALRILTNTMIAADLKEVHETENSVYLIMELFEGGEAIDPMHIRSMDTINFIAKKLLMALTVLEKHKIVYGNLIESNILLVYKNTSLKNNKIRLVGFGNAIIKDSESSLDNNALLPSEKNIHIKVDFHRLENEALKDINSLIKMLFRTLVNLHNMVYSSENTDPMSIDDEIDLDHIAIKNATVACKLISARSISIYG